MHGEGQAPSGCLIGKEKGCSWDRLDSRDRAQGSGPAGTGLRDLGLFLKHAFKLLLNSTQMFHHFHYRS